MTQAFIVDGVRTPIGSLGGSLSPVRADDLAAHVIAKLLERHPEDVITNAVRRMLPRNALGRQMMTKLKVYPGAEHPHAGQSPVALKLKG